MILLGESFTGSSTIRAFGKSEEFINKNNEHLNKNILSFQILLGCWNWYGIRISTISSFVMCICTTAALLLRKSEDPIFLAMTLSYIL